MPLVDNQQIVFRQHLSTLEGVDRHEGVVGHHHIDVLGTRACLFHEAFGDHWAFLAEALVGRDRHLTPSPLGDSRQELVAVAGLG